MKILKHDLKTTLILLLMILFSCKTDKTTFTVNDETGVLSKTNAPVLIKVQLSKNEWKAVHENRLAASEVFENAYGEEFPVQLENKTEDDISELIMIMPNGEPGIRKFKLTIKDSTFINTVKVDISNENEQIIVTEGDKTVLQYNYQMVYEDDVVRPNDEKKELQFNIISGPYYEEYLRSHPPFPQDTVVTSAIYSVPRSDYIHPLYGLDGEMLTCDWPDGGHPHHRGIFWAWPEIEFKGQRGDIYALQRLFARPTGNVDLISGPVYAKIDAENLWMWEDEEPIVKEQVIIKVYPSTEESRIVDLSVKLIALEEDITIATRFTNSYGGLNIRMQTPEDQNISYYADKQNSNPQRAWGDFNGIFQGNQSKSGLMILQHNSNPEYPGEWVKYPELSWVQPTFPTPDTRYALSTNKPLILKYRFIIHTGGKPTENKSKQYWDAYHSL